MMRSKLRISAVGIFLLFLVPALRAQQALTPPSGEPPAQADEEQQKRLARKQAELAQRQAERAHEMAQRQAEMAQRQVEMAQRKIEMAQRQVEMAQRKIELAKRHNPLGEYSPERILERQQEIGLGESQKEAIKAEAQRAQSQFNELQGQLQKEMEAMAALAKPERVDESSLLAQLDRVLGIEREIKRNQIALAARIKNMLTREQQVRLQEIQQAQIQEAQRKVERALQELEQKKVEMRNKLQK